jgi:hypothetical protein
MVPRAQEEVAVVCDEQNKHTFLHKLIPNSQSLALQLENAPHLWLTHGKKTL